MNPQRSAEGWLQINTELRNDDPWVLDDNWHRGQYLIYTVLGTNICVEADAGRAIGEAWDELCDKIRAARLHGVVELIGHARKDIGYRIIHAVDSTEEWNAKVAQGKAEYAAQLAEYQAMEEAGFSYDGADRGL